jgi:2-keto-4-pentenoate hydratase
MPMWESIRKHGFMKRVWFVPLFLFVVLAFASSAAGIEIEKEAETLYNAMQAGERLLLSQADAAEKTEENAYKIQALLFQKLLEGNSTAGYKAGLTTAAQLERFKAPGPSNAPLLKSGMMEIADPKTPFTLKAFPGMMLEVEFVFKTAAPIESPVKDEEALKKLIGSVHAGIEVPQLYFADMSQLGFFDLTAAGVGSKCFVVGPPHETQLDVDSMQVVLSRDGTVVVEGKGTDVLNGQWKTLLWLVNDILARGGRIEAGQYLMTGALGSMIPAQPGKYTATYPFDTLTFEVVE